MVAALATFPHGLLPVPPVGLMPQIRPSTWSTLSIMIHEVTDKQWNIVKTLLRTTTLLLPSACNTYSYWYSKVVPTSSFCWVDKGDTLLVESAARLSLSNILPLPTLTLLINALSLIISRRYLMDPPPVQHLWTHSNPTHTRIYDFKARIETKYNQHFATYEELRQWSISNINPFWEEVWHFTGIKASEPFTKVPTHRGPSFLASLTENSGRRRRCSSLSPSCLFPRCQTEFCREPSLPKMQPRRAFFRSDRG